MEPKNLLAVIHTLLLEVDTWANLETLYLFGFAYLGPFGHFFHMLLDKVFKGKKDSKTVAKKVIVEQLTVSPLNNTLFMIYYGWIVEGKLISIYQLGKISVYCFVPDLPVLSQYEKTIKTSIDMCMMCYW
ncbi:Peroxisomal membrane protein PMP22 [Bienertia sinuspersici]